MPEGRDLSRAMEARDSRAAAEVEAAGGMEGAGTGAADLANALADALAAGYEQGSGMEYGAVAAQDLSGFDEDQSDYAADMEAQRVAAIEAMGPATGVVDDFAGYTQAGLAPSAYAAGQKYGGEQPSVETFGQSWQTAVPDTSTPYDANEFASAQNAPNQLTGQELFGGYQGAVAQGYDFANQTAAGTPGYAMPGVGTGVESFANNPYAEISGTGVGGPGMAAPMGSGDMITQGQLDIAQDTESGLMTGTAGQGGVSMSTPFNLAGGLINQGAAVPQEGGSQTGAITAGTATTTPQLSQDENAAIQDKVLNIAQKVNTPETNTEEHRKVAQSRLDMQTTLDEKAKTDPNGRVRDKFDNLTTVTNQQLANAYRSFDTTLAAYATIKGVNKMAAMIANNLPGVSMVTKSLGAVKDFLVSRGIFNKTSAEDIVQMIQDNLAAGARPGEGSIWGAGDGGGMEAEMAAQQQVASFIQQYPWAANLDPKYIKYLIDNPAELQDLLGQNAGG